MGPGLITRGLGSSNTLVTRGFGTGFLAAVAEEATRLFAKGRSSYKRNLERLVVAARLLRVNDLMPESPIQGQQDLVAQIGSGDNVSVGAMLTGADIRRTTGKIVIKAAELVGARKVQRGKN